jgi:hypothetical protein
MHVNGHWRGRVKQLTSASRDRCYQRAIARPAEFSSIDMSDRYCENAPALHQALGFFTPVAGKPHVR